MRKLPRVRIRVQHKQELIQWIEEMECPVKSGTFHLQSTSTTELYSHYVDSDVFLHHFSSEIENSSHEGYPTFL